jgi:hypothetical protein
VLARVCVCRYVHSNACALVCERGNTKARDGENTLIVQSARSEMQSVSGQHSTPKNKSHGTHKEKPQAESKTGAACDDMGGAGGYTGDRALMRLNHVFSRILKRSECMCRPAID